VVLRHDERMLLNALLAQPEMQSEVIGELRSSAAIGAFSSRRIFQAIFALHEAGGRLSFEEVNARLEEEDRNLLAEAVLAADSETSSEAIRAAIRRVRLSDEQDRIGELKTRIKELDRSGKREEALRLMAQLPGLDPAARRRK
jgi:replicative DNA helicase